MDVKHLLINRKLKNKGKFKNLWVGHKHSDVHQNEQLSDIKACLDDYTQANT